MWWKGGGLLLVGGFGLLGDFRLRAVLAAGSAGFGVVVWPTAAMELANSDTINTKALVAREKLFIAETSK